MDFCSMFKRLQLKWKVNGWQLALIFTTFATGGSSCGYLARKLLAFISIDNRLLYLIAYLLLVTLLWPLCLVVICIPLEPFRLFRNYIFKIFRRISNKQS